VLAPKVPLVPPVLLALLAPPVPLVLKALPALPALLVRLVLPVRLVLKALPVLLQLLRFPSSLRPAQYVTLRLAPSTRRSMMSCTRTM
jgi:hypothetical protein